MRPAALATARIFGLSSSLSGPLRARVAEKCHYIAGDPPRDQDEARARARAGRQVFTGSGAGGALSPLMMVLVHHGLRRNGIALPAGRVVLHRATTSMLYGGPVAEAAWQRVFAEADEVLIGAVHRAERFSPEERLDAEAMTQRLRENGRAAETFATNEALGKSLLARNLLAEGNNLLVFFSNGSFDGVIETVAEKLG